MRFEFILHETLPRLAWCAHLRVGRDVVEIHHGPWVETAADWFVEGAWTGPFGAGGMVEAVHAVGTAGRAERDQVVFCSPTNMGDRIYSVHLGDELYVSNSMSFLLQISGDEPDPLYLDYADARRRQQQVGISRPDKRLPTARGRHILVHDYCNVAIRPDLSIRRIEKPATPSPADYEDYVGQLEATIAAVQANAADPLRRHQRYRPLATVSRGYDCNALAALMRRYRAQEALTFTHLPEDDGTAVAERLGYKVTGYDPFGFRNHRGKAEAEFQGGSDVVMAVCEEQLVGALLVTGRRGDAQFETSGPGASGLRISRYNALPGSTMGEFRLRVGFLLFVPFYVGALHPEAIHRISVSPGMKPWSVGGDYDRPIPRRILENAGVLRECFGQRKFGGARVGAKRLENMSAEGAADFMAFLQTQPPIARPRRLLRQIREIIHRLGINMSRQHRRIRAVLGLPAQRISLVSGKYLGAITRNRTADMERSFHWGYARIRSRYEVKEATALTRPNSSRRDS